MEGAICLSEMQLGQRYTTGSPAPATFGGAWEVPGEGRQAGFTKQQWCHYLGKKKKKKGKKKVPLNQRTPGLALPLISYGKVT